MWFLSSGIYLGAVAISFPLFIGLGYLVNRVRGLAIFTDPMRIGILGIGCFGAYALGSNNVANTTGAFVEAGLISPIKGALKGITNYHCPQCKKEQPISKVTVHDFTPGRTVILMEQRFSSVPIVASPTQPKEKEGT